MQVKRIVANISAENVAAASRSRTLGISDLVAPGTARHRFKKRSICATP
jgi:hypothetical protein